MLVLSSELEPPVLVPLLDDAELELPVVVVTLASVAEDVELPVKVVALASVAEDEAAAEEEDDPVPEESSAKWPE